ncbi:MAG TPA: HAMP domain-containing sensor histidine kinase [Candidatus Dormibacteraeota bacterium]|nr:HAMP domain-containing sensor histidine kinase [Candidatus Dormibacteraeota bacterium]
MLQRGLFDRARLRLAGWYVVFLGIILLVLDVGVVLIMGSALESRVDDDLQRKAGQASAAIVYFAGASGIDRNDLAADPSWNDVSLYATTASGSALTGSALYTSVLPDRKALGDGLAGRAGFTTVIRAGEPFIVYTRPVYGTAASSARVGAVVQVARSARTLVDASTSLISLLLGATLVALLLAFVAGLWLADKALEPIRVNLLNQKDFVSDASHELRTPITVIRVAAESILRPREKASPRLQQLAQDIVSETVQLASMVENLSTLAQADSRVRLRRDPVEVAALLDEAGASGKLLAAARGVELQLDITADGVVRGDDVRLRQLVAILLDNATRFAAPGQPVVLGATTSDGRLRVTVTDSGPGIPEAELPRIFNRFYRGADQRQNEGSGLGLAIARWIVQEHGGTISVRSQVGVLTEFTVELPLAQ